MGGNGDHGRAFELVAGAGRLVEEGGRYVEIRDTLLVVACATTSQGWLDSATHATLELTRDQQLALAFWAGEQRLAEPDDLRKVIAPMFLKQGKALLDWRYGQLSVGGTTRQLSPAEVALLLALMKAPAKPISPSALSAALHRLRHGDH